uniref:Putative secreted protein n=1 Tax=Anopheles marajoara TaxID=58244 RepID=A0A2M4CAW7_9DIPT
MGWSARSVIKRSRHNAMVMMVMCRIMWPVATANRLVGQSIPRKRSAHTRTRVSDAKCRRQMAPSLPPSDCIFSLLEPGFSGLR